MGRICYECFNNISEEYQVCPYCGFKLSEYSTSERVLSPGTVLNGKYVIGRTLGEGGFGITYLAWDKNMEVRIAIKEYYPSNLVVRDVDMYGGNTLHTVTHNGNNDFSTGLQRFVKEAAILSKFFNLPGIVSVKDFFYENGTAYMAMEYVDGISLKEYLKQKGNVLSVTETLEIVRPIISSLAIIHKGKLLHRDISPDNIMISRSGEVKLIDFGAARYFDADYEKSMTVVLKHGYAPIEQYSRKSVQEESTDVYSLCAVIYRMLTGNIPEEAIERIHEDKLVPIRKYNKKIPKYIAEAIQKGLTVEAMGRQQSMAELYGDLYATKKQLRERREDRAYAFIRKIMIFIVVVLILIILGSVVFIGNREKISNFYNKIKMVFTQQESISYEEEEKKKDEVVESKQDNAEKDEIVENERNSTEKDEVSTENTANESGNRNLTNDTQYENLDETDVMDLEVDNELEHAVVVVSQGNLNGISEEYTVGEILSNYGDDEGKWTGTRDSEGNIYVIFSGSKMGDSFTFEFQVFSGDTFKLVAATQNGQECEKYASFFQSVLDEVGL